MSRFVAIWAGQLVSMLGGNLTAFALAVTIYQRTGDVADLTVIAVAAYLPHIVVGPYGGVLADRLDRRRLMILADLAAAGCTALLLAWVAAGWESVGLAAAIVAASASCTALQWPAYEAAIVTLVPREQLGRASGLSDLARGVSQLLAPPIAAGLLEVTDLTAIIAIDLATFAAGIAPLLLVRFPSVAAAGRDPRSDLAAAWRTVARQPGLVAMLALFFATHLTFGVVDVMLKPVVLAFAGPGELGLVVLAVGAGMIAGAVVMSAWGGPRRRIAAILVLQLVEGGALVLAGAHPTLPVLCAAAFVYGLVIPPTFGCARVVWQVKLPLELQGRAAALRNAVVLLAIPIGYAAAVPLAHLLAPAETVLAMGVVTGAAAVVAYAYAPYRRIETELPDAA